ncbi:MAG TPA: low temperature requirement protein A [Streptosporangiaceae bacterium]|jgi:low temperature requirement protein LtrA|nr:low temperature requirement protein A [Streptosporangiaceae bacterium]
MTSPPAAEPPAAVPPAREPPAAEPEDPPLRVSTLELFFDLVFVFTITQLTTLLARNEVTLTGALKVVLVFGVLWWMYGAYAWLTNARTPSRTPERLLLLLGMAGFLIIGMTLPYAFSRRTDGIALGLGYLLVVAVHAGLYVRLNRSILRVVPFNASAAVLVILAGAIGGVAGYWLWACALAVLVFSPLIVPQSRFRISPAHFVERHGAVIIIVLGESVADIGLGAAGHPVTWTVLVCAVLGLVLAAVLWWTYFGVGDDERAEAAFNAAPEESRPALALSAYFYAYVPMLLGIVALSAGIKVAMQHPGLTLPYRPCLALAGGMALFLGGDVLFRRALGIAPLRYRGIAAGVCLIALPVGVTLSAAVEIGLLAVIGAGALLLEGWSEPPDTVEP